MVRRESTNDERDARTAVMQREEEGSLCDPGSQLLLFGSARVVRG